MEIGGKQGSRLTGRMFAKLMDLRSEELLDTREGFKIDIDKEQTQKQMSTGASFIVSTNEPPE